MADTLVLFINLIIIYWLLYSDLNYCVRQILAHTGKSVDCLLILGGLLLLIFSEGG